MKTQATIMLLVLCILMLNVESRAALPDSVLYKSIDSIDLYLQVDYPADFDPSKVYPTIIFYFGGGWVSGNPGHFQSQAEHLASRGMLCFRADYRVRSRHGSSPFESLMDARSAMRFIRAHAAELGVDPQRIVASGGSAGGHLAAACALVKAYDDPDDDLSISCVPNVLALFNPVIDNGPGGYGYERIGDAYLSFSPLHNIRPGAPPTLFMLGTADRLIPVETAEYYRLVMEKAGSRCDLLLYEGQGHGFFNTRFPEYHRKTLEELDDFLVNLHYLQPRK